MSRGDTKNLFFNSEYELLKDRWLRTRDRETLAQLVHLSPPFGDQEVGKAIEAVLLDKRPDQKAANDAKWREIDRVYAYLREQEGKTQDESYEKIREIYFADAGEDRYDLKTIERLHRRWARREIS